MTRLLFPTVILLAMGGIVTSILNSFEHFTLPAIAPVVWNLVIVLALVFGYDRLGVDALAWGVLLGTVLQLLIQLPGLRGRGGRLGIGLDWRNPHVKKVAALMLPVSLSLGLINLNGVVNVQFASLIDEDAVAAMNYAFRLYQLPEALFAIAVGTVLFPTLSKLAARRETAAFRSTISLGIRVIFFLLLPATALMLVLSEPMVRLVYQRGQFDAQTTVLVASALFFFAFGSAFSGGSALLTRGFFSLRRSWVPTGLAVFNLGLNALLNWLLYKPLGLAGISLATSLVSLVTFLLLLWLMRRQLGRLDGRLIAKSGIAAALLSLVVAAAAYLCWWGLDHWLGRATVAQVASLGGALSVAALLFLALAWTFKLPELKLITAMRGK